MSYLDSFKNVSLVNYKQQRNGKKFLSLAAETHGGKLTEIDERSTARPDILNNFFKIMTTEWVEKLTVYGVQMDEDIVKMLNDVKGFFDVTHLIYDSSANEELVFEIREKCLGHESVLKESQNKSLKLANWCDMPEMIRKKCYESMPFVTKMRMRRVSTTEKKMAEGTKHKFKMVTVGDDAESYWVATLDDNNDRIIRREDKNDVTETDATQLFHRAFQFGKVEQFRVHGSCRNPDLYISGLRERYECDVFTASCRASFQNDSVLNVFLEQLAIFRQPNVIDLYETSQRFQSRVFRDKVISRMIDCARELYIPYISPSVMIPSLVQYLRRNPPAIGTTEVHVGTHFSDQELLEIKEDTMNELVREYADRIIYQDDDRIRVSTTNPGRHFIYRFYSASDAAWTHAVWKCVPCDMSNEEFEATTRWQWVSSKSTPDPSNKLVPLHLVGASTSFWMPCVNRPPPPY